MKGQDAWAGQPPGMGGLWRGVRDGRSFTFCLRGLCSSTHGHFPGVPACTPRLVVFLGPRAAAPSRASRGPACRPSPAPLAFPFSRWHLSFPSLHVICSSHAGRFLPSAAMHESPCHPAPPVCLGLRISGTKICLWERWTRGQNDPPVLGRSPHSSAWVAEPVACSPTQ